MQHGAIALAVVTAAFVAAGVWFTAKYPGNDSLHISALFFGVALMSGVASWFIVRHAKGDL